MNQPKDTTPISAEDVSVSQVRLLGEDVLVRAVPLEEIRKSGLWVQRKAQDYLGGCFYGTVVATGPGKLVERGPSATDVAMLVMLQAAQLQDHTGAPALTPAQADELGRKVFEFVQSKTAQERRPLGVKPGDHVAVRFGFGPEIRLRDGLHHVVGRGNSEHGHGVLMGWEPAHVHCWHLVPEQRCGRHRIEPMPCSACLPERAVCSCGAVNPEPEAMTRLPACTSCPPGERLAEAPQTDSLLAFKLAQGGGPGAYEHGVIEDRPGDPL